MKVKVYYSFLWVSWDAFLTLSHKHICQYWKETPWWMLSNCSSYREKWIPDSLICKVYCCKISHQNSQHTTTCWEPLPPLGSWGAGGGGNRSCSVKFSSVAQSCPTLCDPMNHSTLGLPVHHPHLELTQAQVHQVGDMIQPSHHLLSPSPPALNPSQHQGLFQWVNSTSDGQSIGVSSSTSVLPMNTKDWSPLGWTVWISLQFKVLSRVFSNTTDQKHQFFCAQLFSQSKSYIHTWLLGKP